MTHVQERWRREVRELLEMQRSARAISVEEVAPTLLSVVFRRRTALMVDGRVVVEMADVRFSIAMTPDWPFRPPEVACWGGCIAGRPPVPLWHPNIAPIADGAPVCLFAPWPISISLRLVLRRLLELVTHRHVAVDPKGSFNPDAARSIANTRRKPTDELGLTDLSPPLRPLHAGFNVLEPETTSRGKDRR